MQLTLSLMALASTAAAVAQAGFEFPSDVPMDKRQTEGPRYECHANCGFALRGGADDGYCDDSEWNSLFEGCLDCALEFDIWRHYGNGLTPLAEACGLDATPKPANGGGDDEETTTAEEVVSETSAVDTTTVEVTATEESTVATATATATATETEDVSSSWTSETAEHTESHAETHYTSSAVITTTATWTSTYVPTGTGGLNTTAPPEPTNIPGNGAGQNWVSSGLVGAAAVVLAANLM